MSKYLTNIYLWHQNITNKAAIRIYTSITKRMSTSKSRGKHFRLKTGRPLRVLVDMDGVLCDFEGRFLELYRQKFPEDPFIPREDRKTFYVEDQYRSIDESLSAKVRSIWEGEGFFRSLEPIDGAIDAVKEMSGLDNVEVFICTSPLTAPTVEYHYSSKEKFEWIAHHLGKDWVKRMVVSRDKTIVVGDILIDDKSKIKGQEDPPLWDQILFTAPHNKQLNIQSIKNCTYRLDNWTDSSKWKAIIEDYQKKIA